MLGCGGGGSPTSPGGGGATALPTVNGNVSGRAVMLGIDAASPLAATGSSAQTALQYPTQFAGNVLTITA